MGISNRTTRSSLCASNSTSVQSDVFVVTYKQFLQQPHQDTYVALWQEKVYFSHFCLDLSNPCIFKSTSLRSSWRSPRRRIFEVLQISPFHHYRLHGISPHSGISGFSAINHLLQLFYEWIVTGEQKFSEISHCMHFYRVSTNHLLRFFYRWICTGEQKFSPVLQNRW